MSDPVYQHPKPDEKRYAMHYGVDQPLDEHQLLMMQVVLNRFGGNVYQQGDNFFEWGQPVMSKEEAEEYVTNAIERANAQASHVVLYVNRGVSPILVHNRLRDLFAGRKFSFVRARWRFLDLPFCLTDAVDWSQGGNNSWRVGL